MILRQIQETKSFLVFEEMTTGARFDVQKVQLEKAVRELKNWQDNLFSSNFSAMLYNLICKADIDNKKKLLKGFPARMCAYILWYTSKDKEEFYEKYLNLTPEPDTQEGEFYEG